MSPSPSSVAKTASAWAAPTLGICVFAVMMAASIALLAPPSAAALLIAKVLPLAEPHEAAADQAAKRRDFAAADGETRRALALSPVRDADWLRAAQIDFDQHGAVTAAGAQALNHAYDAVPYDLDPNARRLRFALDHFSALPASTRADVTDELAAWASAPALRAQLARMRSSARDPGALSALTAALGDPRP